jgi:hypothetical protein
MTKPLCVPNGDGAAAQQMAANGNALPPPNDDSQADKNRHQVVDRLVEVRLAGVAHPDPRVVPVSYQQGGAANYPL